MDDLELIKRLHRVAALAFDALGALRPEDRATESAYVRHAIAAVLARVAPRDAKPAVTRSEATCKLLEAARLIVEARGALNLNSKMCSACSRGHFENFGDKQRANILDGAINRIQRVSSAFLSEEVADDEG